MTFVYVAVMPRRKYGRETEQRTNQISLIDVKVFKNVWF